MEGGFKTLAHLSVSSFSAVPCGLRSVLVALRLVLLVGAALFLCARRRGYVHHVGSPGAGRVFDVFPQFLVRSWKRQS